MTNILNLLRGRSNRVPVTGVPPFDRSHLGRPRRAVPRNHQVARPDPKQVSQLEVNHVRHRIGLGLVLRTSERNANHLPLFRKVDLVRRLERRRMKNVTICPFPQAVGNTYSHRADHGRLRVYGILAFDGIIRPVSRPFRNKQRNAALR